MNKQLKKAVEAELYSLINGALSVRNKAAAADITKQIKGSVKSIAKKFVKHFPKPAAPKSAKKVSTSKKGEVKKAVSKKVQSVKKKITAKAKTVKASALKKVKPVKKSAGKLKKAALKK